MITCVRNHAELGAHRVTCPDNEGWAQNPGACHGCLPRAAERGFLCAACYERTVDAVAGWSTFAARVRDAEGRLVSPEARASRPSRSGRHGRTRRARRRSRRATRPTTTPSTASAIS